MKPGRLFAAALLALAATASAADPIRIGLLPAADSIVITIASEEGIFKDKGLEVEPVPFRSALEIGSAMRAGALDGHFGDLMSVLSQNASGVKQAVILTTTRANIGQRCFGLAISPRLSGVIKTVSDLRSASTAMSSSTIIDYLLDRMKDQEKLAPGAIKNVEIRQIPVRMQMLMAGKVDAALLPEPLATAAERQGARIIWDDRKLDEPLAVVALKSRFLNTRTVSAFKEAVSEAARRIEANPSKYRELMVKKRLLPKDGADGYPVVRFSLFPTDDGLPPLPTEDEVRRVGKWMASKGMLKSVPDFKDVVYLR